MTNAVATQERAQPPAAAIRAELDRMTPQFALALPPHVSPERFVRVVMTAIQSTPALLSADRQTLFGAAMKCAQDGLLPDGREAALVIFRTKKKIDGRDTWVDAVQYMPMVAGVISKVRRSGELLTISSHVVYEKDAFTYVLGDEEKIEHQPFMGAERGEPVAAYAVAKTKDGGIYREVMSVAEINQVRNVSRAKDSGPWVQWWSEMARKTVIRRLSKRLPMSTDLQAVIERDDEMYDLRQASGAALPAPNLTARLAAPANDGPSEGFNAVHAQVLADDPIPNFDAALPVSDEPLASDDNLPLSDAGGEGEAAGSEQAEAQDTNPAADPNLAIADKLIADLKFETKAGLLTMQASGKYRGFVAMLKVTQAEKAGQVERAMQDALDAFG